jgi:hypothetical protein
MMKMLSKCVLIAAVAALAFAGSTTSSIAAGKKKGAKVAAACVPWTYQTRAPGCTERCGIDGKWYRSMWGMWGACPK